jgi:hypothetical protein
MTFPLELLADSLQVGLAITKRSPGHTKHAASKQNRGLESVESKATEAFREPMGVQSVPAMSVSLAGNEIPPTGPPGGSFKGQNLKEKR